MQDSDPLLCGLGSTMALLWEVEPELKPELGPEAPELGLGQGQVPRLQPTSALRPARCLVRTCHVVLNNLSSLVLGADAMADSAIVCAFVGDKIEPGAGASFFKLRVTLRRPQVATALAFLGLAGLVDESLLDKVQHGLAPNRFPSRIACLPVALLHPTSVRCLAELERRRQNVRTDTTARPTDRQTAHCGPCGSGGTGECPASYCQAPPKFVSAKRASTAARPAVKKR